MSAPLHTHSRRFLIPEIISNSEIDSGLVALQALLSGFSLSLPLEPLRAVSQTLGDPALIETLASVAQHFGLITDQMVLPADHVLLAHSHILPALTATPSADGSIRFLVLWRRLSDWVQIMDPRVGRRWISTRKALDLLPARTVPISAAQWRTEAAAPLFLNALRARLDGLLIPNATIEQWIAHASADPAWQTLARLDAAVRMTDALVRAGALRRATEATRVIERLFRDTAQVVPSQYWSVEPNPDAPDELLQHGIILIRIVGVHPTAPAAAQPLPATHIKAEPATLSPAQPDARGDALSHARSLRQVLDLMRADGLVTPAILGIALVLATVGIMVQALLFQGILDLTALLRDQTQRLIFLGAVFLFMLALFAVEIPINAILLRMGRRLEMRFRLRYLEKIPRLGDQYFQGHLKSDLVQRAHSLRQLHLLPELAVTLFRLGFQLLLTTLGIIWLDPGSALLALIATGVFVALAYFTQPLLQERDLRLRTQMGALSRFYLDAMLGLVPLKMHGAQRAFRREYEALVHDWARANWNLARLSNWLQALSVFVYAFFAVWLVFDFIARNGTTAGTLLFFFWILSLPVIATSLVQAVQQYPMLRSLTLRVLEPLNAPDENKFFTDNTTFSPSSTDAFDRLDEPDRPNLQSPPLPGVALAFDHVSVRLGGNMVLHDINLNIRAGEHVAIVGPSGAGKTTLVGLLLGWHQPVAGEGRADGTIIQGAHLQHLRRVTAWVDPAIQLWNRTLWENVLYGNAPRNLASPSRAIQEADLLGVVEQLDAGMETVLGESGGLVSGGEGQRVRLARGMAREGTRLVILDEPFRGLDRETRRKLLERARDFWRDATLLCVTHDVNETRAFERVLVIENGRLVEDAPPAQLAENPASRYRALLDGEEAVRSGLWSSEQWRQLWIQDGTLHEENRVHRDDESSKQYADS